MARLRVVRPLGWLVLVSGLVCLVVALLAGWREVAVVGVACLLLLAARPLPFLVGRTRVEVALSLEPSRVMAGGTVAAGVHVTNRAAGRMIPTVLELPVGDSVHRYGVPALGAGATHHESFTVRTERRGVITVGPAITRRGDPVGLVSRDSLWTGVEEILVRPPMVPLERSGSRAAARPRGRRDRLGVAERPRLPRAARVRPR